MIYLDIKIYDIEISVNPLGKKNARIDPQAAIDGQMYRQHVDYFHSSGNSRA